MPALSGTDKSIIVHRRISLMKVTVRPVSHSAMTQSFRLVVRGAQKCVLSVLCPGVE